MHSLIGDRFLKRFFGNRTQRHEDNLVFEAINLPTNETDNPDEPGCSTRGNPPDTDTTLENEQTGEVNQLLVPENGSVQPPTDDQPLTADGSRINGDK